MLSNSFDAKLHLKLNRYLDALHSYMHQKGSQSKDWNDNCSEKEDLDCFKLGTTIYWTSRTSVFKTTAAVAVSTAAVLFSQHFKQ